VAMKHSLGALAIPFFGIIFFTIFGVLLLCSGRGDQNAGAPRSSPPDPSVSRNTEASKEQPANSSEGEVPRSIREVQHQEESLRDLLIDQISNMSPLSKAAAKGDVDDVRRLLAIGYPINHIDDGGETALHWAAGSGKTSVVLLLLEKGAAVDPRNAKQETPLHHAAKDGRVEAASLLLKHGANPNAKDFRGRTPSILATEEGSADLVKLLKDAGAADADTQSVIDLSLHKAAERGDIDETKLLLAKKKDVNGRDRQGRTPLHLAAMHGRADVTRLLIEANANVNAADDAGKTPLHYAADAKEEDRRQIKSEKLDFGMMVSETPFDGHARVVELLMLSNANPLMVDVEGKTPLDYAISKHHEAAVELLKTQDSLRTVVQDGHKGGISLLAFNHIGSVLLSGSWDDTIKIWSVSRGFLVRTLEGGQFWSAEGLPVVLAVSLQMGVIASGLEVGQGFYINLRKVSDGSLIRTLKGEGFEVTSVAFSPDGQILASGSGDHTVKLWSISDGSLVRTLNGHSNAIATVTFSSDGQILASGDGDGIIKLWRVSDGSLVKTLSVHTKEVSSVTFSPDGQILASASRDHTVKLWRVSDGSLVKTLAGHTGDVSSVTFSPDGRILASGSEDDTVKLWNVSDGSLAKTLKGHIDNITAVAFSPDGQILASGSRDQAVKLWDTSDGSLIKTLERQRGRPIKTVAFSPNEKIIASGGRDQTIKLWRLTDGSLIRALIAHSEGVNSTTFSPDGKVLASGGQDKMVKLWKISDGSLIKILEGHGDAVNSVAFSRDGNLLASGSSDRKVKIWRVSDGSLIRTLDGATQWVSSVAFSPDGKYLASGGWYETRLWRVNDGSLIGSWEEGFGESISFSPNGKILASGKMDAVSLWGIPDESSRTLEGKSLNEKGFHSSVVFSPDGMIFSYGGNEVKLRKVSDGSLIRALEGHGGVVNSVAINNDGTILASGADDGLVRIWDTKSGELIVSLYAVGGEDSVALTPEGFFFGRGDFNKYIHFVKGLEVFEFNQFYDAFYRPDLVQKKLKGEDLSKYKAGLDIADALKQPPPKVFILSPKSNNTHTITPAIVQVRIEDQGGGIGDVRVYHNGKLVISSGIYRLAQEEQPENTQQTIFTLAARGPRLRRVWEERSTKELKFSEFTPLKGIVEKNYEVALIKGDNTISITAFNGKNTVMSAMETVRLEADIPGKKPELYAMVIGNNNFRDVSQNLSLAIKDAQDFSHILNTAAFPLYSDIHITTLTDVTKDVLVKEMEEIKMRIKPEDIFLFYAATHGTVTDDLYYLFTADFDGDTRNPKSFTSSVELMEYSKALHALKQIFILDTCQSGSMQSIVSGLYDTRISVLAKALGIHILSGTKAFQQAQDAYQGNGLFTYFVLQALRGEADSNKDKRITVYELTPYLIRMVKKASKGTQEPMIKNFGEDLPLAVLHGESQGNAARMSMVGEGNISGCGYLIISIVIVLLFLGLIVVLFIQRGRRHR
jgi:WD40 repeat protein